jgi:hypothetical protein
MLAKDNTLEGKYCNGMKFESLAHGNRGPNQLVQKIVVQNILGAAENIYVGESTLIFERQDGFAEKKRIAY